MQLANGRTQVFMFLRKVYPFLLEENILLINDQDIKKKRTREGDVTPKSWTV